MQRLGNKYENENIAEKSKFLCGNRTI